LKCKEDKKNKEEEMKKDNNWKNKQFIKIINHLKNKQMIFQLNVILAINKFHSLNIRNILMNIKD
jgi:hypothetical protein